MCCMTTQPARSTKSGSEPKSSSAKGLAVGMSRPAVGGDGQPLAPDSFVRQMGGSIGRKNDDGEDQMMMMRMKDEDEDA